MNNLKSFKKISVAILMTLLIVAFALPLLPAVSAANPTISFDKTSGPNGTSVKVTGTGFAASDPNGTLTILVDGLTGKVNSNSLSTNASGYLSGTFTIGGVGSLSLLAGAHSVQISDTIAAPQAITFTITVPTVTLTPSTGPAGTSVVVQGSGFSSLANSITAASYAGTTISFAGATFTTNPYQLSSNAITAGSFKATLSLPAITDPANSTFTLIDSYGNVATATWVLNAPAVTLSPTIGIVGTVVTATLSGFGPGSSVSTVKFGSTTLASLYPTTPVVTEQGTAVLQFLAPLATVNSKVGAKTITVTDTSGNTATASFTITPSVNITLGTAAVDSGLSYAPADTANVVAYLTATGFKNGSALTVTGAANVPIGWLTFSSLTTDQNGAIATALLSSSGTSPASGIYTMTVSDGTNSVTVYLTIASATGNFLAVSPGSGASGSLAKVTAFIAAGGSTGNIMYDGAILSSGVTASAWPTATSVSFNVPAGAGPHTITAANMVGASATFTNTGGASISVVIPSPAAVGTYVTLVGSGFANNPTASLVAFSVNGLAITPVAANFNQGSLIAVFMVPAFPAGTYAISVTDSGYNTATASITTTIASVAITPNSGVVYTTLATSISLTGSGFPMGQAITVTLIQMH